jgi:hypothetical protein
VRETRRRAKWAAAMGSASSPIRAIGLPNKTRGPLPTNNVGHHRWTEGAGRAPAPAPRSRRGDRSEPQRQGQLRTRPFPRPPNPHPPAAVTATGWTGGLPPRPGWRARPGACGWPAWPSGAGPTQRMRGGGIGLGSHALPPGSSTTWLTPVTLFGLALAPSFAAQAGSFTPRHTHHHRSASLEHASMGSVGD